MRVAPFTGAWIEIIRVSATTWAAPVAPFTGAWIEIGSQPRGRSPRGRSLPSRERGLK